MATKVYFINSPDAEYNDNEFAWFQSLMLAEGVIGDPSTGVLGLQVTQNGTPDMSVLVSAGKALVEITKSGRTFKVVFENDASVQKTISANSSGANRVDAVIVRIDKDTDANSLKNNIGTIEVVTGSGATALTDGAIDTAVGSDGWYRLANVTVTNGDTDITTAQIADVRAKVLFNNGLSFAPVIVTGMVTPYAGSSAPSGWLLCDGSAISRSTYADLFAVIGTTFGSGDGSTTFNVPDLRSSVALGAGTRVRTMTFDGASAVDPSNDQITVASNDWLHTGQAVALTGSSLPTGLTAGTYYVIRVSATVIKLAANVANANAGTAVDITVDGSGTCTLTQTLTNRTLGTTGGEETHALTDAEMASHVHPPLNGSAFYINGTDQDAIPGGTSPSNLTNTTTGSAGSDTPHNVMNPYTVLNYIVKT